MLLPTTKKREKKLWMFLFLRLSQRNITFSFTVVNVSLLYCVTIILHLHAYSKGHSVDWSFVSWRNNRGNLMVVYLFISLRNKHIILPVLKTTCHLACFSRAFQTFQFWCVHCNTVLKYYILLIDMHAALCFSIKLCACRHVFPKSIKHPAVK